MCYGCWDEAGLPKIDNLKVRHAAACARAVRIGGFCGGPLHIAVEDWNLDDASLAFCGGPSHVLEARDVVCLEAFKVLTEPERYSAMALADGYWTP